MQDFTAQEVMVVARAGKHGVELLGTAFPVGSGKYATAGHVVGRSDLGLSLVVPKIKSIIEYQDMSDRQVRYGSARILELNPFADIAIISSEFIETTAYDLSGSDDAEPGTSVVTTGFPHADHGRMILTRQNTNVGARVLLGSSGIRIKHLILNIQTRPGQSGSPVFLAGTNKVCAMVIGSYAPIGGGAKIMNIDPATLHQTTHAVSAEYIREMI